MVKKKGPAEIMMAAWGSIQDHDLVMPTKKGSRLMAAARRG